MSRASAFVASDETCVLRSHTISLSNSLYSFYPLAESLHDDIEACEALASLVKGCCFDDLLCSETVDNYPYLTYWHWDLRPALRGVAKVDMISASLSWIPMFSVPNGLVTFCIRVIKVSLRLVVN